MKWIIKLVFLAALLWGGYWFIGARAQEKLYATLLSESRDQGWIAQSRNLGVSGFPNRFDTTLTGLNFRTPDGKWGWQGEEFQLKALSYKPNHLILAWPGEQVLDTPEGRVTLNAELLRASLIMTPSSNLPLSRFQIEGENIATDAERWGNGNIGLLNGAFFQDENQPTRYRLGVELADVTPPETLITSLGGGRIISGDITRIRLSALLDFDREIDRFALQNGQPPLPLSATIEPSLISWGGSELAVSGTLSKSGNGYIEGQLSFDVQNWQPLFEVFKQASNLSTTELITLRRALDGASGGGNLVFTLDFANGKTSIGPFTIGPAPVYPF